jgi:hypothetical protein
MTPWTHIDVFEIGVFRDVIKVEDSRGVHDVKVSWIVPLGEKRPGIKKTEGTGGEVPFPFFTIGDGLKDRIGIAESVGYSATMSFDEALQDAIKNLAPDGPGYPDELKSYTVTSVSAEFGGIAGVSRLRVAIRGSRGGL